MSSGGVGREHRPPAGATRRRQLPEPVVSLPVLAALRALGGVYGRVGLKLDGVEFRHADRILSALADFREGRSRLIIAFRHPYGDEPQVLSLALSYYLHKEAERLGAPDPGHVHARFVHGYELPMWSGPLVRWILPRFGAMPVYHTKLDHASIDRIRRVLRDDAYPLALAPEGQSSYRSETVPRLERGTARLGFWCAGELEKLGRPERVEILPVSVHCLFDDGDIRKVESLVSRVERECGLAAPELDRPAGGDLAPRKRELARRLVALDECLVSMAEFFYFGASYRKGGLDRDARLEALMLEALRRGETAMGIKAEGDLISRVYRIRQEGWDRIYPETDARAFPPLGRRLADRAAGEAWYAMRHMEFVDLCYYLDSAYLRTGDGSAPSFGRLVETAYSAADLASRLSGGNITSRPNALRRRVGAVIRRADRSRLALRRLPEGQESGGRCRHDGARARVRRLHRGVRRREKGLGRRWPAELCRVQGIDLLPDLRVLLCGDRIKHDDDGRCHVENRAYRPE